MPQLQSETFVWNVKHAKSVAQAVSSLRHNLDCSVSPQCITRRRGWGHTIDLRRKLQAAMEELKTLASDDYCSVRGVADYEAACAKLFEVKPRRGYVQLSFKS